MSARIPYVAPMLSQEILDLAPQMTARGKAAARAASAPPAPPPTARLWPAAPDDMAHLLKRARAYVQTIPGAVSGQHGHDQTFKVACALVLGFGLSVNEALPILAEWNWTCAPPWSDGELLHKLAEADKQPGPRGKLRDAGRYGAGEWDGIEIIEIAEVAAACDKSTCTSAGRAPANDVPSSPPRQDSAKRQHAGGDLGDPYSDLAQMRADRGQPGHPDYWREEREAAERQRQLRRDKSARPCSRERGFMLWDGVCPFGIRVRCERWFGCPGCHAYLVDFHGENCRLRFGHAERSGLALRVIDSSEATWGRDRQRIRRAGGSYMAVHAGDGDGLRVVTTADLGCGELVTADRACQAVRACLECYHGEKKRAVRASHDWKTPTQEKSGKFTRLCEIPNPSLELFDEAAAAVGAQAQLVGRDYTGHVLGLCRFTRVGGWTQEALDELKTHLSIGEVLPMLAADFAEGEPSQCHKATGDIAADLALTG